MSKLDIENNLFFYPGAVHIHTIFSDGTGNIDQISKAAKEAGLCWIVVTDHNNMDIAEGVYNDVYVIKGEEISPESANHYLALGIDNVIQPSDDPRSYVNTVKSQGGFGFVAHPDESDMRKNKAKPIKWLDKSINVDGLEIWNWFSDWADNYDESDLFSIAYSYFFRHKLIKGPHIETLKWWDKLNLESEKIIPAIGGVDAHALKISKYLIPIKVFPYKYCFKTIRDILILDNPLSKDFQNAKTQILNALVSGSNLIVNNRFSKKSEYPYFEIVNGYKKAHSGQSLDLTENTYMYIKLFQKADIKILLNGEEFYSATAEQLTLKIEKPGKYRLEAKYKNNPWLYTNPIQLR